MSRTQTSRGKPRVLSHLHGLVLETSIWQLAGSTRFLGINPKRRLKCQWTHTTQDRGITNWRQTHGCLLAVEPHAHVMCATEQMGWLPQVLSLLKGESGLGSFSGAFPLTSTAHTAVAAGAVNSRCNFCRETKCTMHSIIYIGLCASHCNKDQCDRQGKPWRSRLFGLPPPQASPWAGFRGPTPPLNIYVSKIWTY